jgi:acyl-coenzyme A synthetase/AMP-(fatty) acid ligase
MLVPSPLAPPPVRQHLLASTNCKYLLHTAQEKDQIELLLQGYPPIRPIIVPDLNTWLYAAQITPYPYTKSWHESKNDPWLIFHTSGTTGFPKLITYTHLMMTSFRVARKFSEPPEHTQLGWHTFRRCYAMTPMSHFSGLCAALQAPVFLRTIVVTGPATKPPTPAIVADTLRYSNARGLVALPFLLDAMVQYPDYLDALGKLEYIQYVGAALSAQTGTTLSRLEGVKVCPAMGTTECGPYFLKTSSGDSDDDDDDDDDDAWAYYSPQSGQGIHFVERGDDLYELVFKKDGNAVWQQIFLLYPELEEYATSDLFRKHATKECWWKYVGRADDVVVLANGANVHAAVIEERLMAHPDISMALVGGMGKECVFVIIELTAKGSEEMEKEGRESVLDGMWELVDEVNRGMAECKRLKREFVILTEEGVGLVRSPKGGVVRGASFDKFSGDIEALF